MNDWQRRTYHLVATFTAGELLGVNVALAAGDHAALDGGGGGYEEDGGEDVHGWI